MGPIMRIMTKAIAAAVVILAFAVGVQIGGILSAESEDVTPTPMVKADEYIRDRVVKLFSEKGSCSGVQVKAPSGKVYILSAGHCGHLTDPDGTMKASTEDNKVYLVKVIDTNLDTDLLLLTAIDNKSVDVAEQDFLHEHIRTLTHGGGRPTYRTDGELLEDQDSNVLYGPADTDEQKAECEKSHLQHVEHGFFGDVCIRTMRSTITTAKIVPGSSGGGAFDDSGRLIGICSNTDGQMFGGLVPLSDIKTFLKNR